MNRFVWAVLLCAGILCGCAHVHPSAPGAVPPAEAKKIEVRNNAASLLYDLMGDEKNVSKILIIKHNNAELGRLIDTISAAADKAAKRLDELAKADPALNLKALRLPAGEKATRDAIARTKEHELLFSSGEEFEFQLLMTQWDAVSYGWHLAKIGADNSTRPEEIRAFTEISLTMKELYQQVVVMLKTDLQKNH